MCKLTILTKHNSKDLASLIVKTWQAMSVTEKDGYGAAWISPKGKLQYVKSSEPSLCRVNGSSFSFVKGFHELHGKLQSNGGELIIHGRTSTCGIKLSNTHPMVDGQAALIHNGVVSSSVYKNISSSCDSELLLKAFQDEGIPSFEKNISGYYAFAHLQANGRNAAVLTIAKDSRANLQVGTLDCGALVFATTDALLKIVRAKRIGEYTDNTFTTFKNGLLVSQENFKPLIEPYNANREKMAERALGLSNSYYGKGSTSKQWNDYLDEPFNSPLGTETTPEFLGFDS